MQAINKGGIYVAVSAAILLAMVHYGPAHATPGNNGGGNGGCGVGQGTNGCGQPITPAPDWNQVIKNTNQAIGVGVGIGQGGAGGAGGQGGAGGRGGEGGQGGIGQGGAGGQGGKATVGNVTGSRATIGDTSNNSRANVGDVSSRSQGGKGGAATANNNGVQVNTFNPRDRLQAPSLAASFSNNTAPCVKNFGIGGSAPGMSGLLNVPFDAGWCVELTVAQQLSSMGCHNAAVAVIAGVPRNQAIRENPCYAGAVRAGVVRAKY